MNDEEFKREMLGFKSEMLDFKSEMLDFKSQVTRFTEVAEQKFNGLIPDVRSRSIQLDRLEQRLEYVADAHGKKLASISGMLKDVADKVLSHEGRLRRIEENGTISPEVN